MYINLLYIRKKKKNDYISSLMQKLYTHYTNSDMRKF